MIEQQCGRALVANCLMASRVQRANLISKYLGHLINGRECRLEVVGTKCQFSCLVSRNCDDSSSLLVDDSSTFQQLRRRIAPHLPHANMLLCSCPPGRVPGLATPLDG